MAKAILDFLKEIEVSIPKRVSEVLWPLVSAFHK